MIVSISIEALVYVNCRCLCCVGLLTNRKLFSRGTSIVSSINTKYSLKKIAYSVAVALQLKTNVFRFLFAIPADRPYCLKSF